MNLHNKVSFDQSKSTESFVCKSNFSELQKDAGTFLNPTPSLYQSGKLHNHKANVLSQRSSLHDGDIPEKLLVGRLHRYKVMSPLPNHVHYVGCISLAILVHDLFSDWIVWYPSQGVVTANHSWRSSYLYQLMLHDIYRIWFLFDLRQPDHWVYLPGQNSKCSPTTIPCLS